MGKKSKTSPRVPEATIAEGNAAQVKELRDEGNKAFGRKEYQKALDSYESALKLIPDNHPDSALLHSNKAACYMMYKKFKEAVKECTAALDVNPSFQKALIRRAKAYEQLGLYKQALTDIQKANKGESTPETQEAEKRLKDTLAGKRPAGAANGVAKRGAKATPRSPQYMMFQAKCELDGDVRLVHLNSNCTYAELLDRVAEKFPGAGPVMLKYVDKEGDFVTIGEKADLHKALAEAIEQANIYQNGPHAPRLPQQSIIPPIRIKLTKVASEADVPRPPEEESSLYKQALAVQRMFAKAQLDKQRAQLQAEAAPQTEEQVVEIDQWLVDFAHVFAQCTGIDMEKPVDLQNMGWEKIQEGMDAAILSDKAQPIFDQACERFQEVTAMGLLNWGNVHFMMARKVIEEGCDKGTSKAELIEKTEPLFQKALQRFQESLQYKKDFYDGIVAIGQLYMEQAKLHSGCLAPALKPKPVDESLPKSEQEKQAKKNMEEAQKLQTEETRKVLSKISKADEEAGAQYFDDAIKQFQSAIDSLPEEEKGKLTRPVPQPPGAQQQEGQPVEEEMSLFAQALVIWGNLLYERSQIIAAVGGEWKPLLDEAAAKFRQAGCQETDIRQALSNHTMRDDIDLGPEPEPEKKEAEKTAENGTPATEGDAKGEDVKGLPALGPKPKKKN